MAFTIKVTVPQTINNIVGCFKDKTSDEIRGAIKNLEAAERKLLGKVFVAFATGIPSTYAFSDENNALLPKLSNKVYKEFRAAESGGIFSWIINLFKGPWFAGIRIRCGEFKSSQYLTDLAQQLTTSVQQPTPPVQHPACSVEDNLTSSGKDDSITIGSFPQSEPIPIPKSKTRYDNQ